ncbi:MAG TPA: hypothetical protein PL195_09830 [bacterium]|nr:hypothetical protein [bacterium]
MNNLCKSGMVTGTALDTVTTTQTYNQFGEIETYDAVLCQNTICQ